MSSKGPLYQLKDLLFRYGERFELNVPDFSVESGAALGLIGPNGGGKTTLLRILAFIDRPHGGTIFFDGKSANIDDSNLTRSVSMLLQEPYLLKRTVFENVAYGLKVRGERKRLKDKVDEALAMVGLDYRDFARRSWYELSGGEAQRVALGSRLILKPRVLILDEPTASVDEKSALLIKDAVIESRKRDGTTLIIASHDHFWLNSITGDIRRVYRGRVLGTAVRNVI
ncbi:MAG TPA: ABC transporter ATP-binding protein, partial [Desulfomonilia bacterium]|nr:ABC transporter ATP-binding protein [Desulfomonilia bacterium]